MPPNEEEDWSRMMSEFQAVEGPSADLVKSVEKGRRKLLRGFLVGSALTVFTSSIGIAHFVHDRDLPSAVFALIQVGIPVWLMAFVWRSQRRAWAPSAQTTRAFLELALERSRDWIRRMTFMRNRAIPILVLATVIWHLLLFVKNPGLLHPGSWIAAAVGFGGPYAICAWIFWHSGRRRKKFARQAEALAGRILELGEPEESKAIEI